jgi:hypothetical protein
VVDGNYSAVRDILWRRCTAIVWLDYSLARVLSQALRRTIRRVITGERLYGSNRETIGNALFDTEAPLWLVVRTHGKRRREFPPLFRRPEYRHATVIQLHAPAAAETFLAEARARAEPGTVGAPAAARRVMEKAGNVADDRDGHRSSAERSAARGVGTLWHGRSVQPGRAAEPRPDHAPDL